MPTSRASRPHRHLQSATLDIADLIPGERILSRESIDRYKAMRPENLAPVVVSKTPHGYYVTNGNHRVWAAKELGQVSVPCGVTESKEQRSVASQDDVDCADALKAGLKGFKGLQIVPTDEERDAACKEEAAEEDDPFEDLEIEE